LLRTNQPLDAEHPLRSLHVRASDLELVTDPVQLSFWDNSLRMENLDASIDELRRRFGNTCIQRGIELTDASLQGLDVKRDNVVHPVSFFHV
jgi:DNA polymerase-4